MSSDGKDIVGGNATTYDRLFPPPPLSSPLDLPGRRERQVSRDIFDGNRPGSGNPPSLLSPTQRAMVDAVVDRLAKIARNTNFTAALPAHTTPGYWSNNIDKSAQVALAGAVTPYQTVLSYTAPPSRYGRISAYGFDVDNSYAYDGTIQWRMVLNGVPVQDLLDVVEHRGSMVQPAETFIIVPMGQILLFQVRRTLAAGGTFNVDMKIKGWDWLLRNNAEGTKASITAY
jgi:hypothetical protein